MEKKKLKLNELKVQSFVTDLSAKETLTLKGGDRTGNGNCHEVSNGPECANAAFTFFCLATKFCVSLNASCHVGICEAGPVLA